MVLGPIELAVSSSDGELPIMRSGRPERACAQLPKPVLLNCAWESAKTIAAAQAGEESPGSAGQSAR